MNFFLSSISSIGGGDGDLSFTEKLFGRRQSIASVVESEAPGPVSISLSREEILEKQVAQLTKKLARATTRQSFALSESAAADDDGEETIHVPPEENSEMSVLLESISKSSSILAKAHAISQEKDSLESY